MASNQTQHYQLSQWEASDKVERLDFNADNAKIDEALHTLTEQVAGKAESSAVSSLTSQVNTKADQSALTAAVNRVAALETGKADQSALEAQIQAHAADVATLRSENCWVKLAETVLTQAASEVIMSVPNAGQLHKVLLEYSADGAATMKAYFLSQADLNSGTLTPVSVIDLGSRNNSLTVGSINILRAGSTGRLAAFGRYLSIDSIFEFDEASAFFSTSAILFQNLAAVRVEGGKAMNIGSRFALYGMKK